MTATPDTFAAVVAELRELSSPSGYVAELNVIDLCDRIERLDAEMREEIGNTKVLRAELNLMTHKLITCGVAASHPDPALSRRDKDYGGKWDSPQAQDVRVLRDERDDLRVRLAACEKDAERYRWCRENMGYDRGYFGVDGPPFQGCGDKEDFDAAIDAVLASRPKPRRDGR